MNKNESKYFNTAKKMNDALVALLEKKEFEYISIKEICHEANVNRSTFYLHYETINDLLDEVIKNMNSSFQEYFKHHKKPKINDDIDDLYLIDDDHLIPYLNFIKENKKVYKTSKDHPNLFSSNTIKDEIYENLISKILDRFNVDEKYKEYIFEFFISGLNKIILMWCDNDCDLEIREIAYLIKKLIPNYK